MSDEIKNEDEDVEAHGHRTPFENDEPTGDDSDDDVEAHGGVRVPFANSEPTGDGDDDVEAHSRLKY
jgi:hypothetical protein